MANHFESAPMLIGKTKWRIVVRDGNNVYRPGRVTEYQFWESNFGLGYWASQRDWKTYDINDTYFGMPRSLKKIFVANRENIEIALTGLEPALTLF